MVEQYHSIRKLVSKPLLSWWFCTASWAICCKSIREEIIDVFFFLLLSSLHHYCWLQFPLDRIQNFTSNSREQQQLTHSTITTTKSHNRKCKIGFPAAAKHMIHQIYWNHSRAWHLTTRIEVTYILIDKLVFIMTFNEADEIFIIYILRWNKPGTRLKLRPREKTKYLLSPNNYVWITFESRLNQVWIKSKPSLNHF